MDEENPMTRTAEEIAWINLSFTPGVGPKTIQGLREHNVSATHIYAMDAHQLKALGFSSKSIEHVLQESPSQLNQPTEQALNWEQQAGNHLMTFLDEAYPQRLSEIQSAPAVLMVRGNPHVLNYPQVAMVGSRYPTSSGAQQAYDFAQGLAHLGVTITSGLARGVDALAHQGVLDVNASTIAVLGTGLNCIYPKAHASMVEAICEKGAVVSEFPLDTKAFKGNFPRRNRIVSGLSLGTLVVEATLKSGSLITARQALEQNREVMAIPGAISNPQKAGCHFLIRQGAKLIESVEQVMEELQAIWPVDSMQLPSLPTQTQAEELALEGPQLKVYKALDYDGMDMDTLALKTQLPIGDLSMVLMELELMGALKQEQGVYALC